MIKKQLKKFINGLPYINSMVKELEKYKKDYYPGHYHSPIVSTEEIQKREKIVFDRTSNTVTGVDLKENDQFKLLTELVKNYSSIPFTNSRQPGLRYYYENGFYCQSDGIFLHLMIRHFQPKSIIEVGSGFSSALMLDTNEVFFKNSIGLTFIEPYPVRLNSLFKPGDSDRFQTIVSNLQDVSLDVFDRLEPNDILFIDSTHVSKTDSDVNWVLFNILPRLKKGVLIHFHDIFYPFEYPKEWVLNWNGFGWNEDYILKAFLMYNPHYEIVMFNTFMEQFHRQWFNDNMPVCLQNEGGSIWLRKL